MAVFIDFFLLLSVVLIRVILIPVILLLHWLAEVLLLCVYLLAIHCDVYVATLVHAELIQCNINTTINS